MALRIEGDASLRKTTSCRFPGDRREVRPARNRAVVDEVFRLREDYFPHPDRMGCDSKNPLEKQGKEMSTIAAESLDTPLWERQKMAQAEPSAIRARTSRLG